MKKILVADDEVVILEEMIETLIEDGYQAFSATSVDEALYLLIQNEDVSVIITDLKMPGKTGVDFIHEVNQRYKKKYPFIITPCHGNSSMEGFDLIAEKFTFLRKPVDVNLLLNTIKATYTEHKELKHG